MVRFGAKKVNSRSPFFFGAKLRGGELRQQRGVSYPLKLSFTFFFWPKSPGWRAATAARRFPPSRTLVHLFYFNFPGRLQPISHALVHSFIFFPRCCNQSFPLKHLFTFFTSRSGEATKYHALVHSFIFFPRCCNQSILPSQTLVHLFYFTLPWRLQPISRDLVHSFIFFPGAATKVSHPLKLSFTFFFGPNLRGGELRKQRGVSHLLEHLFTLCPTPKGVDKATAVSHLLEQLFTLCPTLKGVDRAARRFPPSQTLVHLFYFTLPWRLQPISRDLVHSFIFFPCAATKVFHPLKLSFTFFLVQISGVANRNSSTPDNCCHFTHQNPGVLKRFYYYVLWPDSALLFEVLVSKAISFSKQSSG